MSDLISRSALIKVLDECVDTVEKQENKSLLFAFREFIKSAPAIDAVPVVHDIRKLTSFLRVKDVNKWQSRIILDEGEESKNCAVFYRELDSDLVPVVRCKDCRHSDLGYIDSLCFCTEYQSMVSENGFCYKGARMDEKEND